MKMKQSCCGCSAKIGTTILLWCTAIWCIVGLYVVNYHFYKIRDIDENFKQWTWIFDNHFYRNFLLNLFLFIGILSVIGLYGMCTENPHLLMPYVIYRVTIDVLIVVGFFPLLLDVYLNPEKYGTIFEKSNWMKENIQDYDHIFIIFVILEFLFVAIEVHFIKVILSCYDLIEEMTTKTKNEILTLSGLPKSSLGEKFYFIADSEISTTV